MDSYPGDLLAGVFPLVFAVNAILPVEETTKPNKAEIVAPSNDSTSTSLMQDQLPPPPPPPPPPKNRGLFDKFLDAMAASLADEEEEAPPSQSETRVPSFLSNHGHDEESSSSEDDEDRHASRPIRSFGTPTFRITHTRLGVLRGSIRSNQVDTPLSTAYARALQLMDEGFFQRARIISISARHGFPPSKDPHGRHVSPTTTTPEGILPVGWMEKHVHALPSVLLLVTSFDASASNQKAQDDHLVETIEHLRYSLAPKRECRIQLACLASAESSAVETDEWVAGIMQTCHLPASCISILDAQHDLQCIPTSPSTRQLHKTVRDASLAYYLGQARRVKRKLSVLDQHPQPQILAIRYCFKIGILYEFLLKHEKSTKYLAQAYRHLEHYYHNYILSTPPLPVVVNPQEQQQDRGESDDQEQPDDGGVEVSLAVPNNISIDSEEGPSEGIKKKKKKKKKSDTIPSDMAHQCRALADWLNLKLLQAGFLSAAFSSESDGLVAAASQWRRHSTTFLSRHEKENPLWNHWKFSVHQRLVMAQLVERQPPRNDVTGNNNNSSSDGEVLSQLCAWRKYQATAESMLRLGAEIEKAQRDGASPAVTTRDDDDDDDKSMRPRFVGSIDSEGLRPKFLDECKRNHKELALELIMHAVSLFENEMKKQTEKSATSDQDDNPEKTVCRAGARMYYLAGGILIGLKRFQEAIPFLEKAVHHAAGWNELELVIRRMLIECYEMQLLSQDTTEEERKNVTNMILDSYFHSKLSLQGLRRALDHFSTLTGALQWHGECTNDADQSMPFSFLVTFPGSTHATAGDVVMATVTIKSNLDYAVHINSVTLLSMAGKIEIPSSDLLCAKNANDGSNGGIIMQAKSTISISTMIDVPKDVDSIASDESGNGGEKEGSPGKGSFSKSARPRASGLTSAGGARLIDERSLNRGEDGSNNAQWSLGYLGGKPLRCDAMSLVFYPLYTEKAAGAVNLIEFQLTHKKPKTHAPIKKTPFEEDNYISSAWSRPHDLPLSLGPRCLRVLGPMAQMVVTNLSNPLTNGTAMEGTVNRVLIKLQAGPKEECGDIKYKVACSNTLLSLGGATAPVDVDEVPSFEREEKVDDRTPVLVTQVTKGSTSSPISSCDYDLPEGWQLVDSGQGTIHEVVPETSHLRAGESTYICLDLYRPPPALRSPFGEVSSGDNDMCQTDFDVAITYRQARPSSQLRRRTSDVERVDDGKEKEELSDLVFLEYSGSVLWAPPISAEFLDVGRGQTSFPSGSSHKSNMVEAMEDPTSVDSDVSMHEAQQPEELPLVDGQRVNAACVLVANSVSDALGSEIENVSFENNDGHLERTEKVCDLRLVSDCHENELYRRKAQDFSSKLVEGSKFHVNYAVEARMSETREESSASFCLGVVCVDWKPIPLTLESEDSMAHGPLALTKPSTIKYWGPQCYIEKAPFEACLGSLPSSPQVSVPFDMSFRITNKTPLYQKLTVAMSDADCSDVSDGLLLSGLVNGEICLAPRETQEIWYTALATRAGKMQMPAISVSALRYKTWVINHGVVDGVHIFVVP